MSARDVVSSSSTPPSVLKVLVQLGDWPVDSVAAAVIGGSGPATAWGDTERLSHGGPDTADPAATWGDTSKVFELKSVSKLLTAYAVLVAVEEGAFELDDAVPASVAPHFDTPPTVRELLAHASGASFAERYPERPARRRRIYSSAGFEMLAQTITETTGIEFADYADEAVNKPLGMSVAFDGSAGHGFRASVDDLAAFAAELLHPRLLDRQTVREAMTVQYPELDGIVPGYGMHKPCPWGLGFELHGALAEQAGGLVKSPHWMGDEMPHDVAGHFGQSGTFLWVHPGTGSAAVVLTDRDFGDWAKPLWADFNNALWGAIAGAN